MLNTDSDSDGDRGIAADSRGLHCSIRRAGSDKEATLLRRCDSVNMERRGEGIREEEDGYARETLRTGSIRSTCDM